MKMVEQGTVAARLAFAGFRVVYGRLRENINTIVMKINPTRIKTRFSKDGFTRTGPISATIFAVSIRPSHINSRYHCKKGHRRGRSHPDGFDRILGKGFRANY